MNKLNSIIQICLKEHKGGEIFFDNLDDAIRNDNSLLQIMIDYIWIYPTDFIIVSGNFGIAFTNYCKDNNLSILAEKTILVPGGLRNGMPIGTLPSAIANKHGIFVDDSFYLGRTRNAIADALREINATLDATFVFYDGSRKKDDTVHSFYRYYNKHNSVK